MTKFLIVCLLLNLEKDPSLGSSRMLEVDYRVKLAGRLKKIKPKHIADFIKGCILRWEDCAATRRVPNQKQKGNIALSANEKGIDKEKSSGTIALKVYSRDRARRLPKSALEPERNCNLLEEFNEVMESDFDGDKQIVLRPDSSSICSFSNSEEIYLSYRATEEDSDLRLEGISSLLEDSESLLDNHQHALVQKDNFVPTYFVPPINVLLSSSVVEVEAEKVSSQIVKDASSNNKTVIIGDSIVEWKNVQDLLTQMGLQLVPATKKTKSARNIINARRKKDNKELQNLKFNVNYN